MPIIPNWQRKPLLVSILPFDIEEGTGKPKPCGEEFAATFWLNPQRYADGEERWGLKAGIREQPEGCAFLRDLDPNRIYRLRALIEEESRQIMGCVVRVSLVSDGAFAEFREVETDLAPT